MHIVLGATGHVGSALAQALLDAGELVTVVTRSGDKAEEWESKGAAVAVVDLHDVEALREVFRTGTRLFLLNPPADPSTDTVAEEKRSLGDILAALEGSGIEKVVAESTYGAQAGDGIGDAGVLYEMEQALDARLVPAAIIRGAYYMSNWDASLETARTEGKVHSLYPADFALPMVAPQDLGQVAARLMTEPVETTGRYNVEGPETYTPADVAAAFAEALGRPVEAVATPRDGWRAALKGMGFSDAAADSFVRMTALALDTPDTPDAPERGPTTLKAYIDRLVRENPAG